MEESRPYCRCTCLGFIVEAEKREMLLLKRMNEPAKGQWRFPSGRIHLNKLRVKAALRKLKVECGLTRRLIKELGTYDVLLKLGNSVSYAITTALIIKVHNTEIFTNSQSSDCK